MIRVQTGSRLHLGLFCPAGGAARRYGGVGLMVQSPGLALRAEPAATWSAQGPLAERALEVAGQVARSATVAGRPGPALRLCIEHAAAEHAGLGTGTQLGLAVARAVALAWGLSADLLTQARWSGRGRRSGVGLYGFEQGGLIVDAGQPAAGGLPTLAARAPVPQGWRFVLARPCGPRTGAEGLHGTGEGEAFGRLGTDSKAQARIDALCRIALLGLLPAARESDLSAFGEAVFEFNRKAGEAFEPVQGGVYAGPVAAGLVALLRARGALGVGQSSWGPTVFAVVGDADEASSLAQRVEAHAPAPVEVIVTPALNEGACACVESELQT